MRTLLTALLALTAAGPALADIGAARQAYASGDYVRAAETAAEIERAEAQVLAAEAISTRLVLEGANARAARTARGHAEAALEMDPDSVSALVQLAVSYGLEARASSDIANYFRGSAARGREALDRAQTLQPNNAQARAVSGAWHLEILWRGGETAQRLYGANAPDGIADFEAALQLGAAPMAGAQYAALLLALDPAAHRDRARATLDWTLAQPVETAFDDAAVQRAGALREALDEDEARAALIRDWLGEP
ncbi:hypothetical protein [Euryhalocaulis caribicus]|uniref:hypothetical protein n=1 Tax=Euryhalocaulis caribicus TaxID=1161401 RepID=UPI0003B2EED8|nr:hypothetical protein [Euryhalocaulis caribicus]